MSKEMIGRMRKFLDSLEAENVPANHEQMEQSRVVQNAMDMGSQSPNSPNLSDDAENKDQGGFNGVKSNSASGMGESESERSAMRKKAFVSMYKG